MVQVQTHRLRIKSYRSRGVNGSNTEAMAVYGPINSHLWAWKDDGEFLRAGLLRAGRAFRLEGPFLGRSRDEMAGVRRPLPPLAPPYKGGE